MDFVHDQLATGRKPTIVDTWLRFSSAMDPGWSGLAIEIEGGQRPVYVLELILLRYRSPRC